MEFAYPSFLFALFLLVIPILIHLFHFRKYKTILFSSIAFVKSVNQEQNSPRKIKHFLILLSRLLALSSIVFAFAKPFFPNKQVLDNANLKLVGLYIDNSFSMSRLGSQGELFAQAKSLATSFVNESPRSTQFLIFTNELDGSQKRTLNKNEAIKTIESLTYTPLVREKQDLLNFWDNCLTEINQNQISKEQTNLVYISDFQQGKLPIAKVNYTNKLLISPLLLQPENTGNLYVDTIWFATPLQQQKTAQTLYARIQNSSNENIESAVVTVQIGDMKRDLFASMKPNQSDTVELTYYNQKLGEIKGVVTINDNQMTQDDSYFFNYEVKSSCDVLIIDGEESVPNVQSVFGLDSYFNVKSVSIKDISAVSVADFDLVVLNGLNQFPSYLNKQLSEFSEENGSILLFPGTNISIGSWNSFFNKLQLPPFISIQTTGLTVKKINYQDPFFSEVFEKKPQNINIPIVQQAYRYQANGKALFLPLIQYQNGSSLFLKSTGKRNVYVLTTSLSSSFSSFTTSQLFSTLLLHVGRLSQNGLPLYLIIGSDSRFPISKKLSGEAPVQLKNRNTTFIPKLINKNRRTYLSVSGIEAIRRLKAGTYQVEQNNKLLSYLSLNYNREESTTAPVLSRNLEHDFAKMGVEIKKIQDGSSWNNATLLDINQHTELWRIFVILAGFFLLCEMIIQIFYKK